MPNSWKQSLAHASFVARTKFEVVLAISRYPAIIIAFQPWKDNPFDDPDDLPEIIRVFRTQIDQILLMSCPVAGREDIMRCASTMPDFPVGTSTEIQVPRTDDLILTI